MILRTAHQDFNFNMISTIYIVTVMNVDIETYLSFARRYILVNKSIIFLNWCSNFFNSTYTCIRK